MAQIRLLRVIAFLILAEAVSTLVNNTTTIHEVVNKLPETRRKGSDRSTSSSSGERKQKDDSKDDKGESLEITDDSKASDSKLHHKYGIPKSSAERRGWRKWHRKCPTCPLDIARKWREPGPWICGAYQRARRSFKSLCMMRFRNCQDGTMFVKISNRRCKDGLPGDPRPLGVHFFYDYKVHISGDSSKSK